MVLGGAKVADKLPVVGGLLGVADQILIGGGMAFTFLAAQGHGVGLSLLEGDLDVARGYLDRAAQSATPRPERMEREEPVHRLGQPGPDRDRVG